MKPKDYLDGPYLEALHWALGDRSRVIVDFFRKYVEPNDSILELGCSAGRNLKFLSEAGFKNVTGLEMSDEAVKQCKFQVIHGHYEELDHGEFDVIFSASFLQEFEGFPQEKFNETLSKCRKYFMIFGDAMRWPWEHPGFEEVEKIDVEPFTQPIIILKRAV